MKKTLILIAILLPSMSSTLLLTIFCIQAYSTGRDLTPGFHVFLWVHNVVFGALVYLPALAVSSIAAIWVRKQIKESAVLRGAVTLSAASLLSPFLAIPLMEMSFFNGRESAYDSIDCHAVYQASMELSMHVSDSGAEIVFSQRGDTHPALPPAIAELSPLEVCATTNVVIIQMDGGGAVMYDEGIAVVLLQTRGDLPAIGRQLHKSLPVYRYRIDDYRSLLDIVRACEPPVVSDGKLVE